jgi:hypothetical protein
MILGKASRLIPAALACISLTVGAGQGIHIDGSSEAAANHSFQRMLNSLDTNQKTQLATAVVQLNMIGVETASDAPQNPSAGRIRDKIAGMTSSEIIELAHRTATNTTATATTIRVPKVVNGQPKR